MNHEVGVDTSMAFFVFSKSSRYEALSCVPCDCPAIRCANSADKEMLDGWVRCNNGNLSRMLVSHWLSFFQLRFTPQMVLLSGSAPIATFVVRACSERCLNVPLIWKFLLKSYSQFMPNMVFLDCP